MAGKLLCSQNNAPIGALIVAEMMKSTTNPITVEWGAYTTLKLPNGNMFASITNVDVLRAIARLASPKLSLFGSSTRDRTTIDSYLTYCLSFEANIGYLNLLNNKLRSVTYLAGNQLTIADLAVFGEIYKRLDAVKKIGMPMHLQRWYDLIAANASVQVVLQSLPSKPQQSSRETGTPERNPNVGDRKQEGKFVELPGAEMGKVIVRFPPEASGFLHIGHAKAALLNQYYQQAFQGKLIMRFDDTNPAKETIEFEKVILEDLEMLEIKPDLFTHTSQYFDLMLEYCEELLKSSKAYVDDTPAEQMKIERDQRAESKNRSNSVEKNFQMWNEMLKGSVDGQKYCVRAKIDMTSHNGCLRDPTIYRCKNEPHPRTGTQYKVYPTYDFACPIVDAIEDVTHTLRTTEYHDRDDQFYWFIDALGLRKPYIWEYSRLNMTNTVLSKRKLTWFVEEGLVDGWDDPRFPTVRGILRRGMTVEGLKQFIIAQGSSKSVVFMEWDKIWSFNKKVIDPIAPRYTALEKENTVVVNVAGAKLESIQVAVHPKNESIGKKTMWVGPKVLIDYVDAECLKEGENTTFINWGNLMIKKINRDANGRVTSVDAALNLDNTDFKKTLKLTWLCQMADASAFPSTFCVYFEHIISKPILGRDEDFKNYIGHETRTEVPMLGDPELKNLKKGDIIQLQRRGFFKVDNAYSPASELSGVVSPVVLLSIPDGHSKEMPTAGQPKKAAAAEAKTAANAKSAQSSNNNAAQLSSNIQQQGVVVRDLKTAKATKPEVDVAVKVLLDLKAQYKSATGQDWKPEAAVPQKTQPVAVAAAPAAVGGKEGELLAKITAQGDQVRQLKANKADKATVTAAVNSLLALKNEYKDVTGKVWTPETAAPAAAPVSTTINSKEGEVLAKITAQGDQVRQLKANKADKATVTAAVNSLLALKNEYKDVTGKVWTPETATPAVVPQKPVAPAPVVAAAVGGKEGELLAKITAQGDQVRQLKANKADKATVTAAVNSLLALKNEYKEVTGKVWTPEQTPAVVVPQKIQPVAAALTVVAVGGKEGEMLVKIAAQGDLVRQLKANKADKATVAAAVNTLLALKTEYKEVTGKVWTPESAAPAVVPQKAVAPAAVVAVPVAAAVGGKEGELLAKIAAQGDQVRQLKSNKADKATVTAAVNSLLALKNEYKEVTGKVWTPEATAAAPAANKENMAPTGKTPAAAGNTAKDLLTKKVTDQGNAVRQLKTSGAAKSEIDVAIKQLLVYKAEYKQVTGEDFPAPAAAAAPRKPTTKAPAVKKETGAVSKKPEPKAAATKDDGSGSKKQTRLGLEAKKEENLPDWYSQVITKGELIEYYDVSGCYILRHWSYAVWKVIKSWFDDEITKMGVKECYFPMFVSRAALEKEKTHIADFAPEVAWVTKSGDSELAEPIAIRPTSETVMYPAFAKWVQSYRDLPIRLNQWSNVVRWEFKHPQPFLRTREFLWQEGHTAFANSKDAQEEVLQILDLYAKVYTDLLAIPVIKGRKTKKEAFAGADFTTTVEAFISASGRAIQGATSHHLGQNFSKMFEIVFDDPETQEKSYVFQNSWGITTRTIGVMVMVHADNQGLVLPPAVAAVQTIIVPCGLTANTTPDEAKALHAACHELEADLKAVKVKVEGDYRDNYSPGWKYNHWELKGVPIRVELGPKDMKAKQFVAVRRDTGEKLIISRADAATKIPALLKTIQQNMFNKADKDMKDHVKITKDFGEFCKLLDAKNIILSPFCGEVECEENIKTDSASDEVEAGAPSMGAKSLCVPFDQPTALVAGDKCVHPQCTKQPLSYTLFGRSY